MKQRGIFEKDPGSGIWWIRYADQFGRIHREKSGSKSFAVSAYQKRKTQVREGRFFPDKVHQRPVLFAGVAQDFLEFLQSPRAAEIFRRYGFEPL